MQNIIPLEIRGEILSKVHLGQSVASLARQYAISDKTIYRWLKKEVGEDSVSILKYNKLKRENEELKRLIGQLTLNMTREKKGNSYP